ncbi:SAM-dependent methyltransferase [Actinomadura parmotrematis]|uniref:SAM-dependent methyltransferase n=1 Tax=Actinomadura parmotrematis TaxID=2864039 RepID=A0ABS7G5F0_9ACTN|nr:SAM-dependent methyltransferase [Actinomadura parmotrematis]MBW8487600.1 SAM-dependent methyltransferase [Actinomadura parmotrematis]
MERLQTPAQRDWAAWHDAYDDPASSLSRRLATVRARVAAALDAAPPGPVRAVSLCAGQGRDLIGAVAAHPRRADVRALLVEIDPANVLAAQRAAAAAGLAGFRAIAADAARTAVYTGAIPADLVLACGVFGNIGDGDVRRTISILPQLCAPGARVVWTRNRQPPDLTPQILGWFADHGFAAEWISPAEGPGYGVGVHRYTRPESARFDASVRMFTFVGYDVLRNGAPWPE